MAEIRIQKFLADAGYCSRRKAEVLIQTGHVKKNGRPVSLGDKTSYKRHYHSRRSENCHAQKENIQIHYAE